MCWQHGWVSLMMNIAQYYAVNTVYVRLSDLGTEIIIIIIDTFIKRHKCLGYRGAGNTVKENSSVFSLIRMR